MRFKVAHLLKQSPGASKEHSFREDIGDLDEDLKARSSLRGKANFIRTTDGILATGEAEIELELTCDRCLTSFPTDLRLSFQEEFHPTMDINSGARLPMDPTEGRENLIDACHMIDLGEVLRQDILLALPVHPLCRPDCKGLCTQCGQNLNEGPCDCPQPVGDPRLTVLGDLLKQLDLKGE